MERQWSEKHWRNATVDGLLFKASVRTLLTIAGDPRHLGARIGLTSVPHAWESVQVIVPGGALSPDGARRIACRPGVFLPVRVLSRLFRRLFLEGLGTIFVSLLPFIAIQITVLALVIAFPGIPL